MCGRDAVLACEELTLRARGDLDCGRDREAALQLEAALSAAVAELAGWVTHGDLAARLEELRAHVAGGRRRGRARRARDGWSRPRSRPSRRWRARGRAARARALRGGVRRRGAPRAPVRARLAADGRVQRASARRAPPAAPPRRRRRASRRPRGRTASGPSSPAPASRPRRSVSAGSSATGQTSSDEPIASISPRSRPAPWRAAIARSGSISPNSTTSGFSDRAAVAARHARRARRVSASEYDAPHARHEAVRIEPWTSIGSASPRRRAARRCSA